MADRLDVIIFGASGFTGKYTVLEGVKILSNLKWGIAGRNKAKLEATLREVGGKLNKDISDIPIFIADITDEDALVKMAEKAKVLVNCCGPYRFYGEAVVKACIHAGTHHVDVSGEPQYMERMQLEYNDLAKEKGVYIISACGFDSIPADLGTVFSEKHFDGVVNSVEAYLKVWQENKGIGGVGIHYGTWESAVHGLANAHELGPIRTKLFAERLPEFKPKLRGRLIHRSKVDNSWCLPFPGSDRSVVNRSQRIFYETEKKRPVQMREYVSYKNLTQLIFTAIFAVLFGIMTKFACTKNLLLKHPKIFSLGFFSHKGPSDEASKSTRFSFTFYTQGWPKEETSDSSAGGRPTKTLITKVSGSNPGYGATCVALLLSATTILKENSKMPGKGGVLPPAAAFAKTDLISELSKNGVTFEVVSGKEEKPKDE